MYSKFKSLTMGLSSSATFSRQDLWKTNFGQYDNVVIFGVEQMVKFIYSERATKFCEISTLLLPVCTIVKSKVEISQNFVALSEYVNFMLSY